VIVVADDLLDGSGPGIGDEDVAQVSPATLGTGDP